MKLNFNMKNKEASLDADIEGVIEKSLDHKSKKSLKKTGYQIRQEEKRKNKELKFELERKKMIQGVKIMLGLMVILIKICIICTIFGWE